MTQDQLKGIIALAITNNPTSIISALNANGYPTSMNISGHDLALRLIDIWNSGKITDFETIMSSVKWDKTKITDEQLKSVFMSLNPNIDFNSQKFDWQSILNSVQGFIGGTTSTGGSTTTSAPALSPKIVQGVAIFSIVVIVAVTLVVIFKK